MEKKYVFRRTKEKMLSDLVYENSKKYYSMLKILDKSDLKLFFISIVSEISNSIFDFYVDINRTNNVFYNNINKICEKRIKDIFTLNSMFFLFKTLDKCSEQEKKEMVFYFQTIFKYSKKDKKMLKDYMKLSEEDFDTFFISFVNMFSRKVFLTKSLNHMEFTYISYYLENSYGEFNKEYGKLINKEEILA